MANGNDIWKQKNDNLRKSSKLAASGATVEQLAGDLTIEDLIELRIYGGPFNKGVQETIVAALKIRENELTPAALSASTAVASLNTANMALAINETALQNAIRQRKASIIIGISAIIVSLLALAGTSYIAFFKKVEISDNQVQRLKSEIIEELRSENDAAAERSIPRRQSEYLGQNPFVPPRN